MGFEKHLFISYAHLDNEPLTEQQQGWITRFHTSLAAILSMRLGRKAEIWRDSKLSGNDIFADQILQQFPKTALQISDRLLNLNQGTLYPALVRQEQYGWIKGTWGRTESNREAKYYEITKAGQKALREETQGWRRMSALVERLLLEES
jgi:Transcriptional regulator PadR-like family